MPVVVVVPVVPVVVVSVVVPEPDPVGGDGRRSELLLQAGGETRSSVFCVRAALGRNFFTLFAPISLCATTVAICGAAQFGELRRPGRRSGGDGSDRAGGRKRGEALTHVPVIDRDAAGHYPLSVVPVQITPEPDEAERKAILAALAAEEAEQPERLRVGGGAPAGARGRAGAVTARRRAPFRPHVGGVHPL